MRQNSFKQKVLTAVLTLVALMAAHSTASAYTTTYTVSGGKGNSANDFYAQFTDGSTQTNRVSWTYNSTAEISFNLKTNLILTLSNTNKQLIIRDNATGDAIGGQDATTLTVSGNDHYYIYRVRLMTADGNVIQLDANGNAVTQGGVSECDYWNMTKSFSQTYNSGILFSKIEVSYDTAIPITDAVISGLNASYIVSNAAVEPVPTVTWHGTTLTKNTHYTLSYQNNTAAGTATVKATGKGIFSPNTSVSANYTLYWATYNVRFNKNNDSASGTMADQAFTYNTAQNLTANAFTRLGYNFARWNTKADGSGTSYTDGQSVSNLTTTNGATVNLYAQWTPITYAVTLDNQGATTAGTTEVTATFDAAMPAITVPERTDYTFDGYYTAANGGGTKYYNADGTSANNWNIAAPTTLYAKWSLVNVRYIDARGTEQVCSDFTIIQSDGEQSLVDLTLGDSNNDEAWYVVIGRVQIWNILKFNDKAVHLILCDNATLTIEGNSTVMQCSGSLTIYGQSGGTGRIEALGNYTQSSCGINASGNVTINSGNVKATGYCGIKAFGNVTINGGNVSTNSSDDNNACGINASGNVTINGGNVNATGYYGIYAGNVTINGGNVSANGIHNGIYANYNNDNNIITLGWTNASDYINANLYSKPPVVKSGQTFTDGTQTYSGTLTNEEREAIDSKTLRPCVCLTLPEHVTASGTGVIYQNGSCYAVPGTTVTLNASEGYIIISASYNDGSVHAIDGTTFTMPTSNVTITATLAFDLTGNGTADHPYQISNYAELKVFATIVNGTNPNAWAKLVDDIICKNSFDDPEFATDWVPIGNASRPYTGTFDGKDNDDQVHTITGLSTPTSNSSDYVGLFGYIGSGGAVKDVILENATITGNNHVGVIAGYNNNGTLTDNYYISCSVNSTTNGIGTGSGDCDGVRGLYTITLPNDVTAATAVIPYTNYYAANQTVTLSYTGGSETFTMPAMNVISLLNGFDSSIFIANNQGSGKNVVLTNRTLYKDGDWNTLCLPFNVSTTSEPLAGDNVVAMTLNSSTSGLSGTTLTLNFTAAETIPAGTPFIIKWGTPESHPNSDLENPVFPGVTIDNSASTEVSFTGGTFKGTYNAMTFTDENKSILFLGGGNKLYYPESGARINAFRAYFQLTDPTQVKEFKLSFDGEDSADGIERIQNSKLKIQNEANAWYDLSGRRLDGKPTRRGIFINGGRKVIIQ